MIPSVVVLKRHYRKSKIAALNTVEPALHIAQQANHDICPHCLGSGECADTNSNGKCGYCGGTGKRS